MKTNANDPIDWSLVQLQETSPNGIHKCRFGGLTKREYFAAMAMQGLLNNYVENGMYSNHPNFPMVEEVAVKCADQLIEQLNKE